jgi:hypothetical protein
MNRRANDPKGEDHSKERGDKPWCVDHHNQLQDIWVTLRGNGHPENGLAYRIAKMEDRQSEILDFVKQVKGVFWKSLPVALGGALSAIGLLVWQVVKMLWEHGKL